MRALATEGKGQIDSESSQQRWHDAKRIQQRHLQGSCVPLAFFQAGRSPSRDNAGQRRLEDDGLTGVDVARVGAREGAIAPHWGRSGRYAKRAITNPDITGTMDNIKEGDDTQLNDLLEMINRASRGEIDPSAIEDTLSRIVPDARAASKGNQGSTRSSLGPPNYQQKKIIPDTDNYDDSDDENASGEGRQKSADMNSQGSNDLVASIGRQQMTDEEREARKESLEQIPMGKMGERMLITFGDGPTPCLDVISETLLHTRTLLQRVVLDARALRRRQKDQWHQARAQAVGVDNPQQAKKELKKTSTGVASAGAVDNDLTFMALDGVVSHLRHDVPCGFDTPQLETLFPEVMQAYKRWKVMHDDYTVKAEDSPEILVEDQADKDMKDEKDGNEEGKDSKHYSERLMGRLENFDVRTDHMESVSYLKFADNRRGSFLPKSGGKTLEMRDRREKKRGRTKKSERVDWQSLSPVTIVFLHWVGFDPRSALSPPNQETASALGFLAYDIFGKICERAVSLRLESSGKAAGSPNVLPELSEGDQLEKIDIDRAMADVDLKSLHCSSSVELGNSSKMTQLYFGPGFEDRLELEMDE